MHNTIPYTRKIAEPQPQRPWTPEGQLLLREALDLFGKAFLKDAWTGEEVTARSISFHAPEPPPAHWSRARVADANSESAGLQSNRIPYVVDGRKVLMPYKEALARFEAEKVELMRLWREEEEAFRRYCSMVNKFRKTLYAGHVPARILQKSGQTRAVPVAQWGSDDVDRVFWTGVSKFISDNIYELRTHEGLVIVPKAKLVPYLERSYSTNASVDDAGADNSETAQTDAPVASKRVPERQGHGGRPTKHEWEKCWLKICVIIYLEGIPKVQAKLVRRLADWFSTEFDKVPAESEIKKRVSAVFHAISEADNSERR